MGSKLQIKKRVFLLFGFVLFHSLLVLEFHLQLSWFSNAFYNLVSLKMNATRANILADRFDASSDSNKSSLSVIGPVDDMSLRIAIQPQITIQANSEQSDEAKLAQENPNQPGAPVLVVCVPSAARLGDSYLNIALASLHSEIQKQTLSMKIEVVVIDVSTGTPRDDMQAAKQGYPQYSFESLRNKSFEQCSEAEMRSDSSVPGRPPCSVMQQTRDVLAALAQCSTRAPGPRDWVTIIEDDTELCSGGAAAISSILSALSASPSTWRYAGFSTYFSGASFPVPALPAFLAHAAAGQGAKPIDHLVGDPWAAGMQFEYPGNLLAHRGRVSVFEYRNTPEFHSLYDGMRFSARQSDCLQASLATVHDIIARGR